ncbi:diaminopimelate decarboxylase [Paraglaciecola arctica]|uniref:Diaminopimelate decarboxylase n=1 Tax=Paraglaciecola arctica BSs20135 TaxID=493475 RepID=K6YQN1_9ALTE|nr:diaminopimelate decarboxylase [Paraglaciecola arctica]GAC18933.1 diaminopimelate decarboxylase [Paraglaciecola arctica BSs20135]
MDQFNYNNGTLFIEKTSIEDLTQELATPFYLYSNEEICNNYHKLNNALGNLNAQICYAVKANSNQAILTLLASMGSGADVVSEGELKRALSAGIAANKIVFSGVGKTSQEITFALKSGIFQFNVESEPELKHISELCVLLNLTANIAIRINPDIAADTHEKISTGKAENKFGIEHTRTLEIYAYAAKLPGIKVQGIDVHIGSQINDLTPFEATFKRLAELVIKLKKAGHDINVIDIGGGLGVTYNPEQDKKYDLQHYANLIHQYLAPLNCKIIVEPGRSILASAGVLVTKINYIKTTPTKQFLILDAGMNDFARPSLYDAYHQIMPIKQHSTGETSYDIVGPVCETGDTFAKSRNMPIVAQGDYLVIKDTGAYGAAMSSTYNTRPLIREVMVKGLQYSTIRAPQTIDDIINQDKLPEWLIDED